MLHRTWKYQPENVVYFYNYYSFFCKFFTVSSYHEMESDQVVGFMLKAKHFFVAILRIEIFCVNSPKQQCNTNK